MPKRLSRSITIKPTHFSQAHKALNKLALVYFSSLILRQVLHPLPHSSWVLFLVLHPQHLYLQYTLCQRSSVPFTGEDQHGSAHFYVTLPFPERTSGTARSKLVHSCQSVLQYFSTLFVSFIKFATERCYLLSHLCLLSLFYPMKYEFNVGSTLPFFFILVLP